MRLLGIDFETTGLDVKKDRIIEVGAVLWDAKEKKPLRTIHSFVRDFNLIVPEEATKVHGITQEIIEEFGYLPKDTFGMLDSFCQKHAIDYLVAHNGEGYDKPILMAELDRHKLAAETLRKLPWIDTLTDIEYPEEIKSRGLNHIAADHGFINPFKHRAIFDVLTMLRILADYDIEKILEYKSIPFKIIQAKVTYDTRELAKAQKFSWQQVGDKVFQNKWVKRIKANKLEEEKARCQFEIVELQ